MSLYYQGNETQAPPAQVNIDQRVPGDDPQSYLADPQLAAAVNVALILGKPLLLTGAPGTGKSRLAGHVAMALGLDAPLRFDTRSLSQYGELFYRFDSLARFDASHDKDRPRRRAMDFVSLGPLGTAILRSLPRQDALFDLLGLGYPIPARSAVPYPQRSVVLIDEIDKAPRDFPNDLLDAIDHLRFSIRELEPELHQLLLDKRDSTDIQADRQHRPVVIITSNSEKNLPDAFLRRCVYCHIPFPTDDQLRAIVARRLAGTGTGQGTLSTLAPEQLAREETLTAEQVRPLLRSAVRWFSAVRALDLRKQPSTAELIEWVSYFLAHKLSPDETVSARPGLLAASLGVLVKSVEDLDAARHLLSHPPAGLANDVAVG